MMAISISDAPSLLLGGIAYGLSKDYGKKLTGVLLICAGIVFVMGMIISIYKSFPLPAEFSHTMLVIIPYIFLPAGIDVFILGILLYKKSKKS